MKRLHNVTVFWKSIFLLVMIAAPVVLNAQEGEKGELYATADFTSKYVWRGTGYGDAPSVMPTIGFCKGNFDIYVWGAYALDDTYREMNIGVIYTLGNVTLELVDYFYPWPGADFFNFKNSTTTHSVEAIVTYEMEKLPFHITLGTLVYGDDKKENGNNAFSTYAEVGYTHEINSKNSVAAVAGFSVNKGYYTDYTKDFGLVNLSAAYTRTFNLWDYELPATAAYAYNPYLKDSWFYVTLSFGF